MSQNDGALIVLTDLAGHTDSAIPSSLATERSLVHNRW
jgi:hypothetical protein